MEAMRTRSERKRWRGESSIEVWRLTNGVVGSVHVRKEDVRCVVVGGSWLSAPIAGYRRCPVLLGLIVRSHIWVVPRIVIVVVRRARLIGEEVDSFEQ